jgi:hypothetical protein
VSQLKVFNYYYQVVLKYQGIRKKVKEEVVSTTCVGRTKKGEEESIHHLLVALGTG